jgi:hypothetical protein
MKTFILALMLTFAGTAAALHVAPSEDSHTCLTADCAA